MFIGFRNYRNMESNYIKRQYGFTLLELLVAVAITGIVATMAYSSFAGISTTKEQMDEEIKINNIGRMALFRLTNDLRNTFLSSKESFAIFKGTLKNVGGNKAYELRFTSKVQDISFFDTKLKLAEALIRYSCIEERDGTVTLYRASRPLVDGREIESDRDIAVVPHVTEFSLEFYSKPDAKWTGDWDAMEAGTRKLPKAVKVRLTIKDIDGNPHPFETEIYIPMGNG